MKTKHKVLIGLGALALTVGYFYFRKSDKTAVTDKGENEKKENKNEEKEENSNCSGCNS